MAVTKSKLKRRLRKKRHLGEFQELGFEVVANLKIEVSDEKFDYFWDSFIDMVEDNKLLFGGGGTKNTWKGFITSPTKFQSPSENDKEKIKSWLGIRSEVFDFTIGELEDAWNNPKWNE